MSDGIVIWAVILLLVGLVAYSIHTMDCPPGKTPVKGPIFYRCVTP
jgi:hypothetical protein